MRDGSAESVLLQRDEAELVLHGRQACREACRTTADDHDIKDAGLADPLRFSHRVDRLASLFDCVANEAHAAKFTRDENAGNVGLEILVDVRNIDPAPFGAENERYCVRGTGRLAGPVSDAM